MINTRLLLKEIYVGNIAGSYQSESIPLDNSIGFAMVFKKNNIALTNKTFSSSDVSLDAISISSHSYQSGLKVRFSTTGILPNGLSLATDYFLIKISENVLMVADSQANALIGSYISITNSGSGVHTIEVQAASNVVTYLEASLDNEIWVKIPDSEQEIQTTAKMLEHESAYYHFLRVNIIIESGQFELSSKIMIKGV